jgi:hypothetical protein
MFRSSGQRSIEGDSLERIIELFGNEITEMIMLLKCVAGCLLYPHEELGLKGSPTQTSLFLGSTAAQEITKDMIVVKTAAARWGLALRKHTARIVVPMTPDHQLNRRVGWPLGVARVFEQGLLILMLASQLVGCGCRGQDSRSSKIAPKPPVALAILSHTTYGYVEGGSVGSDHLW